MVMFTCNACGDALKKNEVEKHYKFNCRNCHSVSCIDCNKDFWGDDYASHLKCVSEEERYSGKNYIPKANANKGDEKQELWIQQVKQAISKIGNNSSLKNVLSRLEDYPNIPRNKKKFENFLKNSMSIRSPHLITEVWTAISAELKIPNEAKETLDESKNITNGDNQVNITNKNENQENNTASNNISSEENVNNNKKKSKKRKMKEEEMALTENIQKINVAEQKLLIKKKKKSDNDINTIDVDINNISLDNTIATDKDTTQKSIISLEEGSFRWKDAIIGVLKKAPDNQMKIKKLRKKVLSEFNARKGDNKVYSEEQLLAKLTKKIEKNPRVKVIKDIVKLVA